MDGRVSESDLPRILPFTASAASHGVEFSARHPGIVLVQGNGGPLESEEEALPPVLYTEVPYTIGGAIFPAFMGVAC